MLRKGSTPAQVFAFTAKSVRTFRSGQKRKMSFEYECSFIAQKSECVIFSMEYRLEISGIRLLLPQEDANAALLEIEKQAQNYGADSSRFVVMGDSAGGEMAAALSILSRERGGPDIVAQILCYPCVGFEEAHGQEEVGSLVPLIFPAEGREELMNRPYISPILDPCIHKTPPTMIIIGTCDFLLDDVLRYARRLVDAGVEVDFRLYQGMIHGFIQMGTKPGLDSLQQISSKLAAVYS